MKKNQGFPPGSFYPLQYVCFMSICCFPVAEGLNFKLSQPSKAIQANAISFYDIEGLVV